jgi:hypothetical protein
MSEHLPIDEPAVDRREEVVKTQQPGYSSTQHVTQDVAAEGRMQTSRIVQIMWTLVGTLEILLGLRILLKSIAANPDSGFASFIYKMTELFVLPFKSLLGAPPNFDGAIFEVTTLIAMIVYALFFAIIIRVIVLATGQTSARTTSRTVTEQTSGDPGSGRTTRTISN